MAEIKIEITPGIALQVLRSLPVLIPKWIEDRGGMAKLHKKLGYASNKSGNQAMSQRKKKGWRLQSLIKFLEVLEDDEGYN
ncbi:MAG: hypothetical protein AAF151_22935 [Cyanobacteria bacterium J06656_5]